MAQAWILVAAAMTYPVSDVGTHLPIYASLGLDIRESLLMVGLLFGFSLFISNRNKSYVLIIVAKFAFILSPWFSEVIANLTSRNMSWRLAWAAPITLLLSIALIAGLSLRTRDNSFDVNRWGLFYGVKVAVISTIPTFIFSYRWVSSSANILSWGLPAHKLPNEFLCCKPDCRQDYKT